MKTRQRLALAVLAGAATYYFAILVPFNLIPLPGGLAWLASMVCAFLAGRFVWRRTAAPAPGLVSAMLAGGLITGGLGFAAGFFGPMLLAPGANQGPLLGIFVTGPLGFVLGLVGGGLRWRLRQGPGA